MYLLRKIAIPVLAALLLCAGCQVKTPVEVEPAPEVPEVVTPAPEVPAEPEPEPIVKTGTATVAAVGDVLMHYPLIKAGYTGGDGYDFSAMFPYFASYVERADYAAANLETTLSGLDNGYPYQGYPRFNCPDGIVGSLRAAGFDLLLTANNHSNDTGETGMRRTLSVIDEVGLDRIGTRLSDAEDPCLIREINGIRVGMVCYTYETEPLPEKVALNALPVSDSAAQLVNTFHYDHLDTFYGELEGHLSAMERAGAEATILFIHWGNEYQTTENDYQRAIAQKACDLGVDVIIGGHPHVIQPVELLTSAADDTHHTVCLYSTGNIVSNQRVERMPSYDGYTEDGVLFSVTFAEYSDGTVLLESADLLPTWVNLTTGESSGKTAYEIIPLDTAVEDWKTAFTLSDGELAAAQSSYERTTAITEAGMEQVRQFLQQQTRPDGN